ncbi:MAG: methyltransferase domain-containing protein [Armatimonadota bacterium]
MKASIFHTSRHVASGEVIDATARCPICLDAGPREAVAPLQADPAITLLRCGHCRGLSASHMPAAETLDKYYAGYYHEGDEQHTFHRMEGFVMHIARRLELPKTDVLRILDFGGGDGALGRGIAERLLAKGVAERAVISVVDYHQAGVAAGGGITVEYHRELAEVREPQSLVLASAVLEHIPDMHGALSALFALVAPGGWFYARTPYMTPFRRVLQGFDLTYPAHVHDLGPSFWNRIADTFNLNMHVVVSAPSPVETAFAKAPVRTAVSHLCKAVAHLEHALAPQKRDYCWEWVGGWEVLLRSAAR